ncbi:response regulator [Fulvivirga lutea]|uniref:Response regulator n=1 Tax=Fulvivirga lutea TaxID=2810512 RepID=A0A974WH05_9BACT|nr:response regulator [Fulvivirga lutea]QSE98176.1 response regulator [Fulvivirga lutea]
MEKQRVLVIHQNEKTRQGIHKILSNYNFELLYAADGLEGLAASKYDCPDLIITDINLPILDGVSLSQMLRNDCCTKNIPIIILNDNLNYQFACQARSLNAKAFLMRPYLDNSLVYAVNRALGNNIPKADNRLPYHLAIKTNKPVLARG